MVPLDFDASSRILTRDLGEQGSLAIRHALIHRRPGLWVDHPRSPGSVLYVRDANDEPRHVYGVGNAEPAVSWLVGQGWRFSLLAPKTWEGSLRKRSTSLPKGTVETWIRSRSPGESLAIAVRRLTPDDGPAFHAAAPAWALGAWGDFNRLVRSGAAFGVPTLDGGFAAIAWIFEADDRIDSCAVAADPRFVRLGLGRAAGSRLVSHIESDRKKSAVWTVAAENVAAKALARSLGFSPRALETVVRWGYGK